MKAIIARFALLLPLAAVGCQNPFDPEADLRLVQWGSLNGGTAILIEQAKATTTHKNAWDAIHNVDAVIYNYSAVPVTLRSWTVVYRQIGQQSPPCSLPPGNAICVLGGAAGRRFKMTQHIGGLTSYGSGFSQTTIRIRPTSDEFLDHIGADLNTINGGIDLEVMFYGTDHNGHDVKVGGSIHVEIF